MTECSICVENFNKIRKPVTCPHCQLAVCSVCIRHFLTENTIEPKCMNCNNRWNMEFLREQLPKTFMDKDYKKHQIQGLLGEAETRIDVFQDRLRYLEREKTILSQIQSFKKEIYRLNQFIHEKNRELFTLRASGERKTQRQEFFMACPRTDCRGRVSTAYKCGLCEHWICSQCHGDKGRDKDETHVCKEDDKETVRVLKENTKQCPKCHTGIFKTEGCDQMWCVSCHTCFSWKTGVILTGTVHNPHYYEFMRQQNGGVAPRVIGDIPCGGLPTIYRLRDRLSRETRQTAENLSDMLRMFAHIQDVTVTRVQRTTRTNDIHYGVDYIAGKTTREQWGQSLYVLKRKRERGQRYLELLQMMSGNAGDLFRNYHGVNTDGETTLRHLEQLVEYANKQVSLMNKQFGTNLPQFDHRAGVFKF